MSSIRKAIDSVKKSANAEPKKDLILNWKETISTGSTLLDLAISGGRCREGGIPGGILVEIYGRSSSGKSSLLSEIAAHAQSKGGEVSFQDPEARLDQEYCKTYGLTLDPKIYHKPDTVTEVFDTLLAWEPTSKQINCMCVDSLAALSTELELTKGDKMGMRRAKEFSEGLRKTCRLIEKMNWIIACSNQVRQGDFGDITPGGKAPEFYSSLRISVQSIGAGKIEEEKKLKSGMKVSKIIGVKSKCTITKSSIDDPYRTADIYIVFGYGIDDIRGNLQYLKTMRKLSKYDCVNDERQSMKDAIAYIEKHKLETELRAKVVDLWHEVEDSFKSNRRTKTR